MERSTLKLLLSKLCLQNRAVFRGAKGERVPRKGEEEGGPAKGQKGTKGCVKTGHIPVPTRAHSLGHVDLIVLQNPCNPRKTLLMRHPKPNELKTDHHTKGSSTEGIARISQFPLESPPYSTVSLQRKVRAFLNLWFAKPMVCMPVAFHENDGSHTKMTKTMKATQTATNKELSVGFTEITETTE